MGERSGRSITLIFREYGVRTTVELAPAAAHTAEQTWQHLPRETTPMHGRYSGPEMVTTPGGTRWQARSNGHDHFHPSSLRRPRGRAVRGTGRPRDVVLLGAVAAPAEAAATGDYLKPRPSWGTLTATPPGTARTRGTGALPPT